MNVVNTQMLEKVRKPSIRLSLVFPTILVVAILVHGALAFSYLQQRNERAALASEVEAAGQSLVEYGDSTRRLQQLADIEAELASEQVSFPSWLSGPGIVGQLVQLAEENGLRVSDAGTRTGGERQVGERTYRTLSVHIEVMGTLGSLRTFVGKVESGTLQTARVNELSITGIAPPPDAVSESFADQSSTAENRNILIASVDLSVYARD